jgi:hypothetical protein
LAGLFGLLVGRVPPGEEVAEDKGLVDSGGVIGKGLGLFRFGAEDPGGEPVKGVEVAGEGLGDLLGDDGFPVGVGEAPDGMALFFEVEDVPIGRVASAGASTAGRHEEPPLNKTNRDCTYQGRVLGKRWG